MSKSEHRSVATGPTTGPWWLRLLLVAVGLGLWFGTQYLIGMRAVPESGIGDTVLDLLAPLHRYFWEHEQAADLLLIVSSAIIDVLGVFLLAWSIFGKSIRPFLGLLMLFALRQACQALIALPAPSEMIWRQPELFGVPIYSLLVTPKVANDFFFSGHTALAVYGAIELVRFGGRRWLPLGAAIAVFEAAVVLVLRAHWTMDVYAGVVTAILIAIIAKQIAPPVDRMLGKIRS